jgi:hypothetical protein
MEYLIFIGMFSFPIIVCILYEVITFKRLPINGVFLTKALSSYGIYLLSLIFSSVSVPVENYMLKSCMWSGEGVAPCSKFLYEFASYVESWLTIVMVGLAVVLQLVFLHYFSRSITFNKQ